jgi:drug/metabolite transporter (DMT)-like permease
MQRTELRDRTRIGAGLAVAAPWIFVLLWSTGFIGARFGLPYIEPFTFLLIRFLIATALLAAIVVVLRAPWPRWRADAGHAAVVGLLLHGGYLGGVFFAIDRGMPAGLSALIVSLQPVLTAIVAPALLGERVGGRQWLGLGLGFLGVALVVSEKLFITGATAAVSAAALTAATVALFSTTAGTLYQKRFGANIPLLSGASIQYLAAAGLMFIPAFGFETREVQWTPQLFFAMGWLVIVLSLGAILLLMLLIRERSAARVTSLFYLVPPATAIEAYLLFGESFGLVALSGLAVATLGVALVVTERRE